LPGSPFMAQSWFPLIICMEDDFVVEGADSVVKRTLIATEHSFIFCLAARGRATSQKR
jgi:hypothetical protein